MKCKRCDIEMEEGVAILTREDHLRCFMGTFTVTAENLKLIKVLKCPQCGYSDDGAE